MRIAAFLTAAVLVFLIGYILVMGIPNLKPELFAWEYNSENVSLTPALINTVLMTAFALLIATPLGIFAAIWLVEYAHRGSKLHPLHRLRPVRYAVLRHSAALGLQHDRGRVHAGDHGAAGHHAHD